VYLNRWEDTERPDSQDFADMFGFMNCPVDSAYQLTRGKGRIDQFQTMQDRLGQSILFENRRLGSFTMNADYLYWLDLEEPVENLILVWEMKKITARELDISEEYREIGKITHPSVLQEKCTTVTLAVLK
jgi:hypothetical protein